MKTRFLHKNMRTYRAWPQAALALVLLCMAACTVSEPDPDPDARLGLSFAVLPQRIAFGSCMHQDKPKPVLDLATASEPDLFIFLGDNIYGDTEDMDVLQDKYDQLAAAAEFQRLQQATTVVATWDDHDYGANDAGKEYPYKETSAEIFLDFWGEPAGTDRRNTPGIYTSYMYEEHGRILQVILLDLRTFRDLMLPVPHEDPDATMLGAAQWAWLEAELQKPADLRVIGSSTQFGHSWNGYESWTNMPLEQQKMLNLIQSTKAEGILFVSGDVHWGELSRMEVEGSYPIWDLTSSGITQTWDSLSPNKNRVEEAVVENNYGYIDIDWDLQDPEIRMGLVDQDGTIRVEQMLRLSALRFPVVTAP